MSGASRRLLLAGGAAALVAGCGEGTWLGENAPPPLPGERKSVLLIEDQLAADPRLATLNVTLPPATRNSAWPQVGGGPTHGAQHLAAAEALTVAWRTSVGSGAGRQRSPSGRSGGCRRGGVRGRRQGHDDGGGRRDGASVVGVLSRGGRER